MDPLLEALAEALDSFAADSAHDALDVDELIDAIEAQQRYGKGDKRGGQFAPGDGGPTKPTSDGNDRKAPLGTEVVKALRQAMVDGGMAPKDVAAALSQMRNTFRTTGEIRIPKAAITAALNALTSKEVAGIVRDLRKNAKSRQVSNADLKNGKQMTEATGELSFDQLAMRIRRAWESERKNFPPAAMSEVDCWPDEVFDDHVIVRIGDDTYSVPYTDDGDDVVFNLDTAKKVQRQWVVIEAMDGASTWLEGPIAEADAEGEPDGSLWDVVIIRAGKSKNRRSYPAKVLQEAAPLFEGAKVLARADEDHLNGTDKSVKNVVGWLSEVTYSKGAVRGHLNLIEPDLQRKLLEAWKRKKKDLVGLSIVAEGRGRKVQAGGVSLVEVQSITRVQSVDIVVDPAAGGEFVRLVAAVGTKEEEPVLEKLIALLKSAKPDVGRALLKEADEETIASLKEAAPDLVEQIDEWLKEAETPPDDAKAKADADAKAKVEAEKLRIAEAEKGGKPDPDPEDLVRADIGRFVIREALDETKLPDVVKEKVRKQFAGKAFREAELTEAIKGEIEVFAELEKVGLVKSSGDSKTGGTVEVGLEEADRTKAALDGFFAGEDIEIDGEKMPRFRSFKEAYIRVTGDTKITGTLPLREGSGLGLSRENGGRAKVKRLVRSDDNMTFTEAVLTSTFVEILGDSITRRMLRYYAELPLRQWEPIVDTVPLGDFRTQRRLRWGGYPNLPTVAQNAAYAALTTPGDEEATYAPAKRGGTETITIEAIANDDVGAIRDIPRRLARAALQTLHEFVFDFLATNPAIYDAVALFAAGHGNLGSTALSAASLKAARLRMRKQADMSNSKRLGLAARNLWVPPDLEDVAFEILQAPGKPGTADNDANFLRGQFQVSVVDYWTDTNNWFLSASKDQTPLIELGFWGPEEPELFTQDLPNVGEMFTNDRLVYKIRHVYGGGVLDFRGIDGSVVA